MGPQEPPGLFRSCLYVPAHQTGWIDKAYRSAADAVILDLEDGVPAGHKLRARANVAAITAEATAKPTYVRVNPVRSGLCQDDVRAASGPGLVGIRIAKTAAPPDVQAVDRVLTSVAGSAVLHPLIESAHALEHIYAIATASPRVAMIGLGESDLWADLNTGPDSATMEAARVRAVIAARAADLPSPAQSVFPQVRDLDGLLRTSRAGKRLGFLGRMAIHPSQIPIIHDVYTPEAAEIAEALEICEAEDQARVQDRSIVITPAGRMVGPPMITAARATLRMARTLDLIREAS
ncbi:MAG: HpcH/HpaI aldolase/citrate lyase family protein [Catenulispora sp.]